MRKPLLLALLLAATILSPAQVALGAAGTDVIGGSPTTISQWPWQVAVDSPPSVGGNGFDRQFCGGSLISSTAVLTAAHCVFDAGAFQQPAAFSLITGRTTLSSSEGTETPASDVIYFVDVNGRPTPQSVTQPAAGPQLYDPASSRWDVAIIELNTPAPAPASPIAIADGSERGLWDAGDTVYATGWGARSTIPAVPNYADTLEAVELKVVSDADCGDTSSYGGGFDPVTMVCAGVPGGGKDTCQGDSGGPLVAAAGDGTFRLVGDTSFGDGCAAPEKWGVYGRVADSTMRPVLIEGAAIAPGGPGTPAVDRTAPRAKLGKEPRKRTTKRKAKFTFSASEDATFSCKLDKAAAAACTSPFKKRVSPGSHRFSVVATDASGNSSAAATYRWKVVERKGRR